MGCSGLRRRFDWREGIRRIGNRAACMILSISGIAGADTRQLGFLSRVPHRRKETTKDSPVMSGFSFTPLKAAHACSSSLTARG